MSTTGKCCAFDTTSSFYPLNCLERSSSSKIRLLFVHFRIDQAYLLCHLSRSTAKLCQMRVLETTLRELNSFSPNASAMVAAGSPKSSIVNLSRCRPPHPLRPGQPVLLRQRRPPRPPLSARQPQGKLVRVLSGHIWDVAVDLRRNSPDFGKWAGFHLKPQSPEGRPRAPLDPRRLRPRLPRPLRHRRSPLQNHRPLLPRRRRSILWNDPTSPSPGPSKPSMAYFLRSAPRMRWRTLTAADLPASRLGIKSLPLQPWLKPHVTLSSGSCKQIPRSVFRIPGRREDRTAGVLLHFFIAFTAALICYGSVTATCRHSSTILCSAALSTAARFIRW